MSFKPTVHGRGEARASTNGLAFATAEEAMGSATALYARWTGCENPGYIESDQPVNHQHIDGRDVALPEPVVEPEPVAVIAYSLREDNPYLGKLLDGQGVLSIGAVLAHKQASLF